MRVEIPAPLTNMADKGVYYDSDEPVYYNDTAEAGGPRERPAALTNMADKEVYYEPGGSRERSVRTLGRGQESFDIEAYEKENFDEHGISQKLEQHISTTKGLVSDAKKRIICLLKFSLVVNIIIVVLILALVGLLVYSNFVSATPTVGKGGSTCIYSTMVYNGLGSNISSKRLNIVLCADK